MKMYRQTCRETNALFVDYKKFTFVGTSGDGLNPDSNHLQVLSKDLYKGLEALGLTQ